MQLLFATNHGHCFFCNPVERLLHKKAREMRVHCHPRIGAYYYYLTLAIGEGISRILLTRHARSGIEGAPFFSLALETHVGC